MRVKAFTLVELVTVLIISGVLISISYWGINSLSLHLHHTQTSYASWQDYMQLEAEIQQQVQTAVEYTSSPGRIGLINGFRDTVYFYQESDSLYRQSSLDQQQLLMSNQPLNMQFTEDSIQIGNLRSQILKLKLNTPLSTHINRQLQ